MSDKAINGYIFNSRVNLIALLMHSFALEAYIKQGGKWTIMVLAKDCKSFYDPSEVYATKKEAEDRAKHLQAVCTDYNKNPTEEGYFSDKARTWFLMAKDVSIFMAMPIKG